MNNKRDALIITLESLEDVDNSFDRRELCIPFNEDEKSNKFEGSDIQRSLQAWLKERKPDYVPKAPKKRVIKKETIMFGNYGDESVEWIILEKQGNKALVLAKKAVDCKPYNNEREDITWENCSLRKWLNEDFLKSAFTKEERKRIVKTKVVNGENLRTKRFNVIGGNDTKDYVFLADADEVAEKYERRLKEDIECKPSKAASENRIKVKNGYCTFWWVRSPGRSNKHADCVVSGELTWSHLPGVDLQGVDVSKKGGVRPVMWIELDS